MNKHLRLSDELVYLLEFIRSYGIKLGNLGWHYYRSSPMAKYRTDIIHRYDEFGATEINLHFHKVNHFHHAELVIGKYSKHLEFELICAILHTILGEVKSNTIHSYAD